MASLTAMNVAASALAVTKAGIEVTSNNVANASTAGYSRRSVVVASDVRGNSSGAVLLSIQRSASEMVEAQRRTTASTLSGVKTLQSYLGSIDGMIGNPEGGLAQALRGFYSSVNDVAREPDNRAYRQGLSVAVRQVRDTYEQLDKRFSDLRTNALTERQSVVTRINELASNLAEVNSGIELNLGAGQSADAGLLDQRDAVLLEMSQLISIEARVADGGTVEVFAPSGSMLVRGNVSAKLALNEKGGSGRLGAIDELLSSALGEVTAGDAGKLSSLATVQTAHSDEFFEVRTSEGRRLFTRSLDIALDLTSSGFRSSEIVSGGSAADNAAVRVGLVTAEGYAIQGYDPVSDGRAQPTVRYDTADLTIDSVSDARSVTGPREGGVIRTINADGTTSVDEDAVRIAVVRFGNPNALTVVDGGYYEIAQGSGLPEGVSDPEIREIPGGREQAFAAASVWERMRGVYATFERSLFQAFGSTAGEFDATHITELQLGDDGSDPSLIVRAAKTLLSAREATDSDLTRMVGEFGQQVSANDQLVTTLNTMAEQIESERSQINGVSLDDEAVDLIRWQQAYSAASKVIEITNKMFDDLVNAL